jgi:hypothetical protein
LNVNILLKTSMSGVIAAMLIGCGAAPTPAVVGSSTAPPMATPLATIEAGAGPTVVSQPGVTVSTVGPPSAPSQEVGGSSGVGVTGGGVAAPGVTALPDGGPSMTPPPTPQGVPGSTLTVTLADNGKTITLQVGQEFLLYLTLSQMQWDVTIENQDVVSRVMNLMPINGAQGIFKANKPGQTNLSAVGTMVCPAGQMCPMLAMGFHIIIVVS